MIGFIASENGYSRGLRPRKEAIMKIRNETWQDDRTEPSNELFREYREPRRRRRRRETLRVALCRRRIHLQQTHLAYWLNPTPENIDCVCEASRFYFAKRSLGCDCRKRRRGHCKYGGGCKSGRRVAVEARIKSRRLVRDLMGGRLDPDWVASGRGFWGLVEKPK